MLVRNVLCAGLAAICLSLGAGANAQSRTSEADEIRAVEANQAAAWNAHDIPAYAALFTPDADVVNVLGWWWKSRAELETKLGRAHQGPFRDSVLSIGGVAVKFPAPDVAVAQVSWTMTGAKTPDGVASHVPERGIQTQVLLRQNGEWRISAFQNTNSTPEQPFKAPR